MTKQEQIKELSKALTPQKIAETVGVSLSYVYRVLRNNKSTTKITVDKYIEAILSGAKSKQNIADFIGIDRVSLYRFEKRNISRKKISRYLYIAGIELKTINHLFRLTEKEIQQLNNLPKIDEIKKDLKTVSAILYPLTVSSKRIKEKHENVNKFLWEIQN